MVTVLAVALGFGIPSACALVAFRWWLDFHPKPAPRDELEARVLQLETWKTAQGFQQLTGRNLR